MVVLTFKKTSITSGFTRLDAVITFGGGLLLVLALSAWLMNAGERARTFICARHLCAMGRAFSEYAHDHNGALPPAVLDAGVGDSTSWDVEIAPYLNTGLPKAGSLEGKKQAESQWAYVFHCPSDTEPHGGALPRSYSMPMYDVGKDGWPPTANSLGGLGLYLDARALARIRRSMGEEPGDPMPAINISEVSDPSDTALLVERISILNVLWHTRYACILSTQEQFDAKTIEQRRFHDGKMNYLFLDGHVELLFPVQSCGLAGTGGGSWTIQAGD